MNQPGMVSAITADQARPNLWRRCVSWLSDNPWVLVAPAIAFFMVFSWYPLVKAVELSLQDYQHGIDATQHFVGLSQYETALGDPYFRQAARNTLVYLTLRLVMGFVLPIALAIAINELRRGKSLMRLAYYIPTVTSLVLVAIVWKWVFNPEFGAMNMLLDQMGLPRLQWLQSDKLVLPSLAMVAIWHGLGYWILIYLAALQGIPRELYESASVDGASLWRKIWHITLPQLRPIMLVVLIMSVIAASQLIVEPMVMTEGGPNNASLTLALYIYFTAFRQWDISYAAALSVILFIVLMVVTYVQLRLKKSR